MTEVSLKAGISHADIRALVTLFYARVRQHPRLGPIFRNKIGERDEDWVPHLAKIEDFWANVVRHERVYSGNPMQAHIDAGNVKPAHFAIWLPLFDSVLTEKLPHDTAQSWSALAHRIDQGLKFGLETYTAKPGDVPNLAG